MFINFKKGAATVSYAAGLCLFMQLPCINHSYAGETHLVGQATFSSIKASLNDSEQQRGRISGTIVDESGSPIAGVTVSISDLGITTSTDSQGKYSIDVPTGLHKIKVSSIAYTSQEKNIQVTSNTNQVNNFTLALNSDGIDEVVVVGYGTSKKTDVTGSTSTISTKQFENAPATRIDQLLQGQASGVDVKSTNGAPGAPTTIRIRGSRSITATNEPIYVIDGIVDPTGTSLNSINPSDIESINILKDAW